MKKSVEQTFRVVKLASPLVLNMRRQRDAEGTSNLKFVADAIDIHLPDIVEQLRSIGLCAQKGSKQSVRLPFLSSDGTLKALQVASIETGVPAIKLLSLCLASATTSSSLRKPRSSKSK